MPRVLTERAMEFLDMIPPHVTGDPNIQAAVQAMSNECDRIDAAVSDVIAGYFPHLAVKYLYLWEASLDLGTPVGLTVIQRQVRVLAFLQEHRNTVPASAWVANVTALIGPTWTWTRHTPGSGSPPPANTIQLSVPFGSGAAAASDLRKLIEIMTPANTAILIDYGTGFLVEDSQIEEQPL